MSVTLDLSRRPQGEKDTLALVSAIAASDDRVERHYLEVKGPLDLTRRTDLAKIAKYILGSANRDPSVASGAFEGYGLMVIGVSPGDIRGIPPVEVMDIDKVVSRYLGADGPRWDVMRVPIADSTNEVLIIVVEPPIDGHPPFFCRKDGDDLIDGRIYIRAEGATREAKSDEAKMLFERAARSKKSDVDFQVEVIGGAHRLFVDAEVTFDEYLMFNRHKLISALPVKPDPDETPKQSSLVGFNSALAGHRNALAQLAEVSRTSGALGIDPETRTEEGYRQSIDRWEQNVRTAIPSALDQLAEYFAEPVAVRVINRTKTFFHDLELRIHLEGEVRGLEYQGDTDPRYVNLDLPSPPRRWGPTQRQLLDPAALRGINFTPHIPSSYHSPMDWTNGGSVDLTIDFKELRPSGEVTSPSDELVLVVPADFTGKVRGTWQITVRDHNDVFEGELELDVVARHDVTQKLRSILGLA